MNEATKLHEDISIDFDAAYKEKKTFKQRYIFWQNIIIENIGERERALDLGCGPGWMTQVLSREFKKVIAVDGSQKMIKLGKEKLQEKRNVEFLLHHIDSDFLHQLKQGEFDLIICSSFLEYIENMSSIVSDIRLLLKENGRLIFSLPNKSSFYRFFERLFFQVSGFPMYRKYLINEVNHDEIQKLLVKKGFRLIELKYQGTLPYLSPFFENIFSPKFIKPMLIVICKKCD